ncbi:outer membrane protein F [Citrobacter freundii]|nr:outer membrane protein F [Citrobacter freundii]
MAIRPMLVLVSKGKLRLTPSCPVTVSGNITLPVTTLKAVVTLRTATKTRLAFAGLKYADLGSFDYGRNYGIVYDALGYTDMLPEFGGDTAYSDNFFVGRVGGVATYRNSNFFGLVDGLNFGVQYLGKNERDGNTGRSNGDGVGGSVSYEMDGFGIVGAYGAADRTNAQENSFYGNGGKKAEQWATGLKYDANNIYLAANYGENP